MIVMQLSESGREKLIEMEGVRFNAYPDAAGLPTIGIGHLLTKDELTSGKIDIGGQMTRYTNGLTQEQVETLLAQDLRQCETAIMYALKQELSQGQFDALVCLVFNIGRRAFMQSTLLKELNSGNYDAVPAEMRRWVYACGQVVNGLIKRREHEIMMWEHDKWSGKEA